MIDKSKPMAFSGIFAETFSLAITAFFKNTVIAAIFILPLPLLAAWLLGQFTDVYSETIKFSQGSPEQMLEGMYGFMIMVYFFIFINMIGTLLAGIGNGRVAIESLEGRPTSISAGIREALSMTFWRSAGVNILMALAISGTIVLLGILAGVFALLSPENTLLSFIIICPVFILMMYVMIRWNFAKAVIIAEKTGPVKALRRSWALVKGNWWRVFGIMLLMSIAIGFGGFTISTPLSFYITRMFYEVQFAAAEYEITMQQGALVLSMLIFLIVNGIIVIPLMTAFDMVFYYDLRIRKNELKPEPDMETTIPKVNVNDPGRFMPSSEHQFRYFSDQAEIGGGGPANAKPPTDTDK